VTNDLAAHWLLDPGIDFLNHGSYGATPRRVLEAQTAWRERMEREPVLFMAELEPRLDRAREELAAFLGAPAADLAFVPNATTGVNTALRSLALGPGDEILTTDHEYNACLNALGVVTERSGARLVVAPVPFPISGPDEVIGAILACVTPRTRYALVSHVTSATALRFPIEAIVGRLLALGVETIVDGAHAPGMVPLDLQALGAAFYTGDGHKWLCGPKGSAFLYVRPDLQASVRPLAISHGANSPRAERGRFRLEFDWTGTPDPTAYLALPEAVRFIGSLLPGGWPEVMARNEALSLGARRLVAEATGTELPAPDTMIGPIAALLVPADVEPRPLAGDVPTGTSALDDPLHDALLSEDRIEVPVGAWPGVIRERSTLRLLRISAQLYNEPEQYRRLAATLSRRRAISPTLPAGPP
jgi:isopenicillin-N epimerase